MSAQSFEGSDSRRSSSRSTASRMRSVFTSPSRKAASIRLSDPAGSGAIILSGQSIFLPTRGISHMGISSATKEFRICAIDLHKAYALYKSYGFWRQEK